MTSDTNPNVHITSVITHHVGLGREPGYKEWIKGIAADARNFDGYLGARIWRLRCNRRSERTGSSA
jgi:antibiotic biosynthesis monooxygenase (ABM) superfamily enzyme